MDYRRMLVMVLTVLLVCSATAMAMPNQTMGNASQDVNATVTGEVVTTNQSGPSMEEIEANTTEEASDTMEENNTEETEHGMGPVVSPPPVQQPVPPVLPSDTVATPEKMGYEFRLCYAYCARKQVRAIHSINNATRECIQACRAEGMSDDEIFENATNETITLKPKCVALCERKRIKAYKRVFELTKECREKCAEKLEELKEEGILTPEDLRERVRARVEQIIDERGRLVYRIRNRTREPVDLSEIAKRVRVTREGVDVDGAAIEDEDNQTPPIKLKVFVKNQARHIVLKRLADKGLIQIDDNGTIVSTSENITIVNGTIIIEGVNKTIKVTPSLVRARIRERLRDANLTEMRLEVKNNKPVYKAIAKRRARLLGLIPVEMSVETEVDAENGSVERVRTPWWAFLAR